ncbi:flagellar protein FlaG [Herbaspirillum sp. HC18]|nr:flagellar protein FlaG [Herbaspirillum sp. HC18]
MDIRPVANPAQPGAAVERHAAQAPTTPAQPAVQPSEPAAKVQQPASVPDMNQVAQAVKNINKLLQDAMPPQNLEFTVDEDSERTVVKVVDQKTKEVLRQIPSEEVLQLSKALDLSKGLLIRQKV